jgi:membrane protease YdiL (CAAX protease family)
MEAAINSVTTASAATYEEPADERALRQLSLKGVIAVWAAAALPMGLLAWVVSPLLADQLSGPNALVRALLITLTGGLIWQFVLVMTLVRREQGTLRLPVLRDALWLRAPRSPRTGRRGGRVWLVLLPLTLVFGAEELIPALPHPASREFAHFLDSHAGHAFFAGSWGWFALTAVLLAFNTVLGEELLFRGYLLPRMNGAFGRRDWLANGVLFAVYHLHEPWVIPAPLLVPVEAFAAKRYRSALVSIAVHSVQTVFVLAIVLSLTLKG